LFRLDIELYNVTLVLAVGPHIIPVFILLWVFLTIIMCVSIPSYWRLFPSPLYGVGSVRCIAVIITVTSPIEYNPGAMV